jgi:RimJ/RimL family protein N-acetyltransferase
VILRTERLLLREYTANDFVALRAIHANPEVQAMRGVHPLSEQETQDEITYVIAAQHAEPRTRYQWIVERYPDEEVVGYCRITITSINLRNAEIGYFLHPTVWGIGLATEVARTLLTFGFEQLNLHRITAGSIDTNTASVRVMEKIGMQREGRLREEQCVNDRRHDTLLYAILEQEWRSLHNPTLQPHFQV